MRSRSLVAHRRFLGVSAAVTLVGTLLGIVPGTTTVSAEAREEPPRRIVEQTETADIYANGDGTHTAVFYAAPVNFFDSTAKQWRKIDNAFSRKNNRIENGAGPVRVQLPADLGSSDAITVATGYWSASLTFNDARSKRPAKIDKGKVRYEQVAPGISLEYGMLSNGLKEDIVLDRPLPPAHLGQFRFRLSLQNASPVAINDGTAISLRDAHGHELARIPQGTMIDANGATAAVDMRLVKEYGSWFVDVAPDLGFLRSADRAYPVRVDPSVTIGSWTSDTFADSIATTWNYNGSQILKAGWSNGVIAAGQAQYFSYLRFPDLTAIKGKAVTQAELKVTNTYSIDSGNHGLTALRTHDSWDASTLTWANMAGHGPERVDINSNQQLYSFNITGWAQGWAAGQDGEWIDNKWSPYGVTINTAGDAAYYELGAAESTFLPNRPELAITYTDLSPNLPSLVHPSNGWAGTSAPPLIAGFSDSDDTTGSIEFEIQGVGSYLYGASGGEAYFPTPNLAMGTYSWRARGKDAVSYGPWTSYRSFIINSSVVLADDFAGPNGAVWNTSNWATTANDPAVRVANIQGNEGQLGVVTSSSRATAKMTAIRDSEVALTYRFGDRTARSFLRFMLRASGATGSGQMPTGYRLELRSDSSTVKLQKCVDSNCGSGTPIASFSYSMNTATQNLRYQAFGNILRVKLWQAGTAEPTAWQIEIADPGGFDFIKTPGVFQVVHNFDTGQHSVYIDNLTIKVKSPEEIEKDFDRFEASGEACAYANDGQSRTPAPKYGRACALKHMLFIRGGYGGATGTWKPGCQEVERGGNTRRVDWEICDQYQYTGDGGPYGLPYQFNGQNEQLQKFDRVMAYWLWKTHDGTQFGHYAGMTYTKD